MGGQAEWRRWLGHNLSTGRYDVMIGFGCFRPPHLIARSLADEAGVPFLSLEEGYLRSGFITAEYGGNNAASPLAGRLPPLNFTAEPSAPPLQSLPPTHSFSAMCRQGAAYYTARTLLSRPGERALFHRDVSFREPWQWAGNALRYMRGRTRDFAVIERLLEHNDGRYFLLPLQVTSDAQMGEPALGWTSNRLIGEALHAFARSGPPKTKLVFKVHPLERGRRDVRRTVMEMARRLSIAGQVEVLETGSLGLLVRHAAGVITINSTAGFSAIFHGTPLLVIGKAVYSHPALATCAQGAPDFEAFWKGGTVAPAPLRQRYLAWIRQEALLPGDFYAAEGIAQACEGIVASLNTRVASASPSGLMKSVEAAAKSPSPVSSVLNAARVRNRFAS